MPPDDSMTDNFRKYPYGPGGGASNNLSNYNARNNKINKFYHKLKPYYVKDEYDSTLIFESRFESGNLRRAV